MISVKRWTWSGKDKIEMEIQIPSPDEADEGPEAVYVINGRTVHAETFSDVVAMLSVPK